MCSSQYLQNQNFFHFREKRYLVQLFLLNFAWKDIGNWYFPAISLVKNYKFMTKNTFNLRYFHFPLILNTFYHPNGKLNLEILKKNFQQIHKYYFYLKNLLIYKNVDLPEYKKERNSVEIGDDWSTTSRKILQKPCVLLFWGFL